MATSSRSRSIRHPQNAYTGAEPISNGVGAAMSGGSTSGARRLSSRTPGGGNGAGNGSGPSRESVAEFEDLIKQTNYAANHYETHPPTQSSLEPRSKTPDARRVRNSLHKPNPNPSAPRQQNGPSGSMSMQSSPPSRPSRQNTTNLYDYNGNPASRERRRSLPSGNMPADHDFYNDNGPNDASQASNPSITLPPLRSRSGTTSGKNKKGMLSFMSGEP